MSEALPVKLKEVDRVVQKWHDRAVAGASEYEYYVQRPKRDPIAAAISMRSTLEAKMRAKETWDKWEQKLRGVGQAGWLDAVLNKGVKRFTDGIEYGTKWYRQFYDQFSKHLAAGLPKIYAMPKATLEDAKRRAAAMIDWNAKFRFIKRAT